MLRRFTIGVRISFMLSIMALFLIGIVFGFLKHEYNMRDLSIETMQTKLLAAQKEKIQVAVHVLAEAISQDFRTVTDPQKQAALLRDTLSSLRFEDDQSGYFFIYDTSGINIAHPLKPEFEGQNRIDVVDKKGKTYIRELADKAKSGGGFVEYYFSKPGEDGLKSKLAYAELIPGTKYWICTAFYYDNLERDKNELAEKMDRLVSSNTSTMLIVIAAIFFLVILPISIAIVRSIIKPLEIATDAAQQIADGNLDVDLDERGNDRAAKLQRALNTMARTLLSNMEEIAIKTQETLEKAKAADEAKCYAEKSMLEAQVARKDGMIQAADRLESIVGFLAEASSELSNQANETRSGAETQQQRIQSTAESMEYMNASVLDVAQNADEASIMANNARETAQKGADVVRQSIEAMNATQKRAMALRENMTQLDGQAQSIGNIMDVINDIADQTNLLALNAAIEAARAGEAGRGFAVVADEVRKLAEKTMGATKEVGQSIGTIQRLAADNMTSMEQAAVDIDKAVNLSSESGEVLKEIVAGAESSASQIAVIATAAEEQSTTAEKISRAVDEINLISSEIAQGATDSSLALSELASQLNDLSGIIEELKTETS
nr:methyl-accepting chemotaxis protein [Desulfovibrio inopinatus]